MIKDKNALYRGAKFFLAGLAVSVLCRFTLFRGTAAATGWSNGCFVAGFLLLIVGLFMVTISWNIYTHAVYSFKKQREERRIRSGEILSEDEKLPEYFEYLAEKENQEPLPYKACLCAGGGLLVISLLIALL